MAIPKWHSSSLSRCSSHGYVSPAYNSTEPGSRIISPPAHEGSQVPSSINRVYSLVHPSLISVPFTYASGIVLPLMGFWNSVIYVTTSWAAVRMLFSGKLNEKGTGSVKRGCSVGCSGRPSLGARRWTGNESDSTKALAVGQGSGYDRV